MGDLQIIRHTSSKGNQRKYISDGFCYKLDRLGYESVSEVLISHLEKYIEGIHFIDYFFCEGGCYSKSFSGLGSETTLHRVVQSLIDTDILYEDYDGEDLLNIIEGMAGRELNLDIHSYLSTLVKLDSITLNEDRHFNNISFIKTSSGVYIPTPIYDNGAGLLSDLESYPMSGKVDDLIKKVYSKPFSSNFDRQLSYFKDVEPLKIDIKSFLSDLNILKNIQYKTIPEDRLDYFMRACDVLLEMLKRREGVAWVSI